MVQMDMLPGMWDDVIRLRLFRENERATPVQAQYRFGLSLGYVASTYSQSVTRDYVTVRRVPPSHTRFNEV